jgi:predicted methyltransferase
MHLHSVLQVQQALLPLFIHTGDIVVDATAGNGHDTLFLWQLTGEQGSIFAFDIQQQALDATQARLNKAQARAILIHDSHEFMENHLLHLKQQIQAFIFNLGYLPGHKDTGAITTPAGTVAALHAAATLLKPGGIICITAYRGHPGGQEEYLAVYSWFSALSQSEWNVLHSNFINQQNLPPVLFLAQKADTGQRS